MALTNFAALTQEQKTTWSMDLWRAARNASFMDRFTGSSPNALFQRIKELKKSEKGARAVITLVADLEGDGVAGDNQLEGNEEAIKSFDQVIQIDQLRNANRHKGRMSDQKSVVNFREASRDVLAYWLADRLDQLAFLTLSGVSYEKHTNGATRSTNSQLASLEFAGDVTAPSTNRHLVWDGTNKNFSTNASTSTLSIADTPSYEMLVQAKALAKTRMIRGVKGDGNEEYYHCFLHPLAMAKLKLDADYLANLRNAGPRSGNNALFTGGMVTQDGLVLHEFRHSYNTTGLADGSKWGSAGKVEGNRILMCGAQAMGFADLGTPYWVEEGFDYENGQGISIGKIVGLKKPVFRSQVSGTDEDFGVLAIDVAMGGADA
jgi:N4-gp56 family major capsid protein